jgi:hypothetical protein
VTARWSYNPKTPDGAGEGEATSRRRVPNPPHITSAAWWCVFVLLLTAYVVWQLA